MKTIMIIGANGQLGSDLHKILFWAGHEVIGFTHEDADITDTDKYIQFIDQHHPHVLINASAFHHVDQCEADLAKAMSINCDAPARLAKVCKRRNIRFIHFSTDYVFDGAKNAPYIESDLPNPLNNYGISKWKGEQAILNENPDALILRVSAIYGSHPCRAKNGLNFVQLMLKKASENAELKVVEDEKVSPTSTSSIAQKVNEIIRKDLNGIVHMTSEGECSWYEFAKEIFDFTHTQANLAPAKSSDFPAKTPRPKYSVLENAAMKKAGISPMPEWKDALHTYLNEMKESVSQ